MNFLEEQSICLLRNFTTIRPIKIQLRKLQLFISITFLVCTKKNNNTVQH